MLLNVILWEVFGTDSFLVSKAKKEDVPCRFCGKRDGDGLLFWECASPPSSMSGILLNLLI